jgi:hypothetical protein
MKRKLFFVLACIFVFCICVISGISTGNFYHQHKVKSELAKIKVGMTEAQVIEILGKPDDRKLSDFSGGYICYKTQLINMNFKSYYLIEMGLDGKVRKVLDY